LIEHNEHVPHHQINDVTVINLEEGQIFK